MTKTYGIPGVVSSSELFHFNHGLGNLRVLFDGGVPDHKNDIPATYTTNDEFEQLVIENSNQFCKRIFLYNNKGQIVRETAATYAMKAAVEKVTGVKPKKEPRAEYPEVKTIGDATEVLLSLGVPAENLANVEGLVSATLEKKVKFPNLKLK